MTLSGWMFMVISIGSVLALVSYCYYRVLTAPAEGKPHRHDEKR